MWRATYSMTGYPFTKFLLTRSCRRRPTLSAASPTHLTPLQTLPQSTSHHLIL
ncbi:hypothetical protein Hanom_Chr02g00171321 [Helianthus anomalus]